MPRLLLERMARFFWLAQWVSPVGHAGAGRHSSVLGESASPSTQEAIGIQEGLSLLDVCPPWLEADALGIVENKQDNEMLKESLKMLESVVKMQEDAKKMQDDEDKASEQKWNSLMKQTSYEESAMAQAIDKIAKIGS